MPNAIWKGHISFGLVSIPIIVYSSEDQRAHVSFRQIDRRNNARIKHQRINVETGEEVPWEDVVKGYEYAKDEVMVVEEGELEKIAGANTKTIAIEDFIDKKNLNFINVDEAYYLVPDKGGEKGYVILKEALRTSNKVGIAKIIISTKEYLAAVATFEDALVVYTLKYDDEIRKLSEFNIPSDNISKYKVTKKEIEIAKQLIDSMTTKWKPEAYKDEYKEAVQKWLNQKINNLPTTTMKSRDKATRATNVINFVDLLKKSLATNKPKKEYRNDPKLLGKKNIHGHKKVGKKYAQKK